jgi:hypothetical protein
MTENPPRLKWKRQMQSLDGLWCMVVGKQEASSTETIGEKRLSTTSLIFQDTYLLEDTYGNKVATFFTSQQAADSFDTDCLPEGVTIQGMPLSSAVNFIVHHIRMTQSAFFALDPIRSDEYRALSAEQFLSALLGKMWESGIAFAVDDSDGDYEEVD